MKISIRCRRRCFYGSIFLAFFLSGCAGQVQDQSNDNGVLVIYGEGLIPLHSDPSLSAIPFIASQQFSESLVSEFRKLGIAATIYPHRDKTVQIEEYLPLLLAGKKRDALVLIMVIHKNDEAGKALYMEASFRPLTYQLESSRVMFGGELKKKYYILSNGIDNRRSHMSTFSKNFMIFLEQSGSLPRPYR